MNDFFKKKRNCWILSNILDYLEIYEIQELITMNKVFKFTFQLKKNTMLMYKTLKRILNIKETLKLPNIIKCLENNAYVMSDIINILKNDDVFKRLIEDQNDYDILSYLFYYILPSQKLDINEITSKSAISFHKNRILVKDLFCLKLSSLNLGDNSYFYLSIILRKLKNLYTLDLSNNEITIKSIGLLIEAIANNINITELYLDLESCELEKEHILELKDKLINLISLDSIRKLKLTINFFNNEFKHEGFKSLLELVLHFRNQSNIQFNFILHKNSLSSDCLEFMFKDRYSIKALGSFDLTYNKISNFELLKHFIISTKSNKHFTCDKLELGHNNITDDSIFHLFYSISKGIHCQVIDLNSNEITVKGVESIIQSLDTLESKKKLKEDTIKLTKLISDPGLMTRIKILNLSNNPLRDEGVNKLSYLISNDFPIEELNLSETMISQNSEQFFNSLNNNSVLKTLNLSGNGGLNKCFNYLIQSIQSTKISSIHFNYCELKDECIEGISHLIRLGISNLHFSNNNFSNHLCISLGKKLVKYFTIDNKDYRKRINYINFSYGKCYDNEVLEDFFESMIEELKENCLLEKDLRNINLTSFKFSIGSSIILGKQFNKFLYYNTNLKNLDLSHNFIQEKFMNLMTTIIQYSSVEILNLTENNINSISLGNLSFFFSSYYLKVNISNDSTTNDRKTIPDNFDILNKFSSFNLKYLKLNNNLSNDSGYVSLIKILEVLPSDKKVLFEIKNNAISCNSLDSQYISKDFLIIS